MINIRNLYFASEIDRDGDLEIETLDEVYPSTAYLNRSEAIEVINHMMKLFVIDNSELIGGIDESGHTGN